MRHQKRLKSVLLFYLVAAICIWILARMRSHATDGGWGLAAMAAVLFLFAVALMALINFYKGFKTERIFFILGLLHLLVLLIGVYFLLL